MFFIISIYYFTLRLLLIPFFIIIFFLKYENRKVKVENWAWSLTPHDRNKTTRSSGLFSLHVVGFSCSAPTNLLCAVKTGEKQKHAESQEVREEQEVRLQPGPEEAEEEVH